MRLVVGGARARLSDEELSEALASSGITAEPTAGSARNAARSADGGALEALQRSGKVKAIGVSNFMAKHLDDIMAVTTVGAPAVNQFEFHVGLHAEDAALGVCAAMLGFRLTTCACFFPWGPCSVYNTSSCARRLCERPLSIHKVKKADWFDRWWPLGRGVSGVFSLSRGG